MADIKSILFVCTGNSCRSAMAEGLMKEELKRKGKEYISVSSAGIMPVVGIPSTKETVLSMKEVGVDVSSHRARQLTADMIRGTDLILVMEFIHKQEVLNRVPEASSKTFLLKEFGDEGKISFVSYGIPDPIGRPAEDYQRIAKIIKREIERIADIL